VADRRLRFARSIENEIQDPIAELRVTVVHRHCV
jgi:hypothetical protein